MMMPGTSTASQLRAALEKKKNIANPISRLIESGQACKNLVTFRKKDCPGLEMIFQVMCEELVVEGKGRNNKEAKIKAALNLIEHVESCDIIENVVKSTGRDILPQPTEPVSTAVPDSKATWPACLELLTDEEKDWVKSLAIFAFNTDTGRPKYKVMKVVKDTPGPSKYKVLCTWNMFFLEGDGESRANAEQEAAMKMMNKVRAVCGMKEVVRTLSHGGESDNVDSSERNLTDQMRTVMVKHSNMLADITLRGVVKLLETFSSKVNSPSPIYSIIDVTTSGCLAMVEVTCTWITLITRGKGSSKVMAEQKAAVAMIKKINEVMKQKEMSDRLNVTETGEDAEPVQYLVYPGHGQAHGQANVTITSRDYLCLQEEQFLNDVIIDFYLKYLQTGLYSNNHLMEKTYTFSIYFYKRLTMNTKCSTLAMSQAEVMHNNVKKWTKNVNIFEKDFIVVPINDCDHWFVIIICYPALINTKEEDGRVMQPLMLVLDSLEDGLKDSVCEDLRSYLTSEWKEKMKSTRKFSSSNMPSFCPKIPQQDNLTDCGLFLLEYVESFFNEPITNFGIPLASLANWFTMEKVKRKREDIARLIRDLTTTHQKMKVFTFPDIGFSEDLKSDVQRDNVKTTEKIFSEQPDPISLDKPATKIKLYLKPKPAATINNISVQSHQSCVATADEGSMGMKRAAETQLGGGKRRQNEVEQEDDQDWWCDY